MALLKKTISSILIVCLIGILAGSVLFYPKQAKANCPVYVVESKPQREETLLEKGWRRMTEVFEKSSLVKETISAAKLTTDIAQKFATWGKSAFMNTLLHQILGMLTNYIVSWIQNGGKPRFLSMGLGSYLGKAAEIAGVNFIDQYLGAGWLCDPFDMDIKIALSDMPTFEEKARCTFSDIGHNIEDFYDDFAKGGWRGWIEVTQPKHNFYGMFLMAQDERNRVVAEAEEEAEKDAAMGQGFLSPKDCDWRDATGRRVETQTDVWGHPPLPETCKPSNAQAAGVTPPCKSECVTKTPSSVVGEMAKKASTNFYDEINAQIAGATASAGPFEVYVTAILNAVINRVMQEGLSAIGVGNSPPIYSPSYGDSGAAAQIPKILAPEKVLLYKDSALEIKKQSGLLKNSLNSDLLEEQKTNLAVLKLIPAAYLGNIPALEKTIDSCENTSYDEHAVWAEKKIEEINSITTPELNQRISDIETGDIPKTLSWINKVSVIINSSDNYIAKNEEWLTVFEKVKGEEGHPELNSAELTLNIAETELIEKIQELVKEINGATASTNLDDLNQEVQDASITAANMTNNLSLERGYSQWPEAGTLYAELEAANNLKTSANDKRNECLDWLQDQIFY